MSDDRVRESERWVTVETPDLPWRVDLLFNTGAADRKVLGLRLQLKDGIDHPGVSASSLGELPIRDLIDRGLAYGSSSAPMPGTDRLGRTSWVAEHYRSVGLAYREATELGESPSRYVRHRWGVSRSTADQWIDRARELGHLPSKADPQSLK